MRAVLLVALLFHPDAHAASLRAQCRLQCKQAIDDCVVEGGKRRRCRRDVLRQCRQTGLAACIGTGSTATTTTATTSSSIPAGTTTTTLATVNGCNPASAADLRGQTPITVNFGEALGNRYDPSCFTVSPGTEVEFRGEFAGHPLVGGRVMGAAKLPDPASPFGGPTDTGDSKRFTLGTAGMFPFYCDVHATVGMSGVAFVAP